MVAIVEFGSKQYIVQNVGDTIEVDRQDAAIGETIEVSPLLVTSESGQARIGTPFVTDSRVVFRVVEETRGDKIRVFKMKSKKRYSRTRGFRADLTLLETVSIS